ncbi:MAG: N-acetylmuramoyl-L-alanine amidase [Legionella sp.]|nr:MAG: N-acetylmuramoyl-L-alanine amidase [Legionella sp.]
MKIIALILLMISTSGYSFSCYDPQPIQQKPIQFDKKRIALTREYQLSHYGIDSQSIEIEPKMIVLHWTMIDNFDLTFRIFNPTELANSRKEELPGDLNVSTHYLVDRDGSIYQLMPENWMARHVIGLNHNAIGIENVGGVDGKDDLTVAQTQANAFLVCYLQKKYPQIKQVIGHNTYLNYKDSPLWLERDPNYQTDKTDPGPSFVDRVKKLIADSPQQEARVSDTNRSIPQSQSRDRS